MYHSFNIQHATEYGVPEAIVINTLQHLIVQNIANNRNFFDGKVWVCLLITSYQGLFPYYSKKQIKRICESLVAKGVLIQGEYSKKPMVNKFWYAFADEKKFLPNINF